MSVITSPEVGGPALFALLTVILIIGGRHGRGR